MEAAPEEDEPNEADSAASLSGRSEKIYMAIQKVFIYNLNFHRF